MLLIYDIFGFAPQTLQGADILAHGSTNSGKSFAVFVPDFMGGATAEPAWFSVAGGEDAQKKIGEFFGPGGPANVPATIEKVVSAVKGIKESGVERIGVMGYCWGAKVCELGIACA